MREKIGTNFQKSIHQHLMQGEREASPKKEQTRKQEVKHKHELKKSQHVHEEIGRQKHKNSGNQ